MKVVYLSLGSNLGDRLAYLRQGVEELAQHPQIQVEAVSSVFQTAPYGEVEQDDFLNIALRLKTSLSPTSLLDLIQEIEHHAKRTRVIRWGPRTLDIDIIWYEGEVVHTSRLTLPHIEAHKRLFVLVPLKQVWQEGLLNGRELDDWIDHYCQGQIVSIYKKRLECHDGESEQ